MFTHSRVPKKTLEKFVGLCLWCGTFSHMKPALQPLCVNLLSFPPTHHGVPPALWTVLKTCLDESACFVRTPPGTSISVGSKLISVRRVPIRTLSDLDQVCVTDRRLWLRVTNPHSQSRKLSQAGRLSLRTIKLWLEHHSPIVSMRPKPLWPGRAFADAHAHGSEAGVGGYLELNSQVCCWFSLRLSSQDLAPCKLPLPGDLQRAIGFFETLARLALVRMFAHFGAHHRLNVQLSAFSDNTTAEAVGNDWLSTKEAPSLVAHRLALCCTKVGVLLNISHSRVRKRHSRFAQQMGPELPVATLRYSVSLVDLWNVRSEPTAFPVGNRLAWLS